MKADATFYPPSVSVSLTNLFNGTITPPKVITAVLLRLVSGFQGFAQGNEETL